MYRPYTCISQRNRLCKGWSEGSYKGWYMGSWCYNICVHWHCEICSNNIVIIKIVILLFRSSNQLWQCCTLHFHWSAHSVHKLSHCYSKNFPQWPLLWITIETILNIGSIGSIEALLCMKSNFVYTVEASARSGCSLIVHSACIDFSYRWLACVPLYLAIS